MPDHNDGNISHPENDAGPLDFALRKRVDDAVAEFDRSLAAAAAQPSRHNLDNLRDATDRLLRAGARVLIELNRI